MADAMPGRSTPSSNRNVMRLVLTVAELVFWVAFNVLTFVLGQFLGCLAVIFAPIVGLAFLILHIVAIIKGINGQRLIIPGISEYADRF
jgi:uncharacterized membrane protein